jgi:hypothetical protein
MAEIKLELSTEEESGYHSLLAFSQLSIGEFCYYNKFEHTKGLEILKSLEEKKLVTQVKGLSDRYIPQFPFLNIADKFKEPAEKFSVLKENLQTFFKTKESEISKNQQEKIKQVNEAITPKITELNTSDKDLLAETTKRKEALSTEMQNLSDSFTQSLEETKTKTKTEFETNKELSITKVTNSGAESEKKILADSKSLKDSTDKITKDFFTKIDQTIFSEIIKEFSSLKDSITTLNNEIESYEKKFNKETINWIQTSESKETTTLQQSKDNYSNTIITSKKHVSEEKEAINLLNLDFKEYKKFETSESSYIKPFLNIRDVLLSSKAELNKIKDTFNDKITEIITADTKNTQETLNQTKSGLSSSFTTILEERTRQGTSIAQQIQESQTSNVTQAEGVLKTENEKINQLDSSTKTSIDSLKTEIDSKHKSANLETTTQIDLVTTKVLPELTSNITGWNDNFNKTFDTVTKTTTDQYEGITQTITELMEEVKAQYDENAKDITNTTTETKNTYTKSFTDAMAVMKKKLDEVTAQLQLMHEEWTTTTSTTFEDLLNKIHTQLQQLVTKQNKLIQTKFSGIQAQIPAKQKGSVESFTKVNTLVTSEIKTLHKLLETQITEVKSLLETHKTVVLTELPEKVSNDLDTLSTSMVQHAEALRGQLNEFLTSWVTITKGFTENWINLETQLRTSEETTLKGVNTTLNAELDSLGKKSSGLRVDLITNAKNENKNLNEKLNNSVDSTSSSLSSAYNEILSSLDGSLDEFNSNFDTTHTEQLESIKQTYDEIKKALTELLTSSREKANTKLQEQTTSLTNSSEKAQSDYNKNKELALTEMDKNIINQFAEIDSTNKNFYKTVLETQTSFVTEIGSLLETFQSSLSDLTLNQMKGLISSLEDKFNIFNETQVILSNSIKGFIETESTVRNSLTQGIDEQAKLLQTNLKDHAGEFEKLAKIGEELLTPPSSLLDKFNSIVKEYSYPQIESAGIIGWSATIVQVETMIKAMKTRVTLLIPNPNDLDILMETISNAKRPKRIDLSCQFDLNNKEHVAIIRKLLNQDNITLRNILEKGGGTETKYPPFLAVDRDGEEVMFGTQDPSNKTAFVGMVSQIGSFIELMGKVVLSDFLSKAKKINQGDV